MTALAQGGAGVALVMCFALLRTGQIDAAAMLLAVQSGAVAITAIVLHQPLMAIPPVVLAAGFWLLCREMPMFHVHTAPAGLATPGIIVGAVLAILCQSQGSLALPFAIVLLAILLAATRSHPLMQVASLVSLQNGVALAGCLTPPAETAFPGALLPPFACLIAPLPLAAGLLLPALVLKEDPAPERTAGWMAIALQLRLGDTAIAWIDVALAAGIFAATLIVPLDSVAAIFAPVLGLDGVVRACVRRHRRTLGAVRRGAALLQAGFIVLAACNPSPIIAWVAIVAAMTVALLPTISRHWNISVLAFLAAGFSLFGLLLLHSTPSVPAYFAIFAGFAIIAAAVPDLAILLVVVVLRLAIQTPWPHSAAAIGVGIAMIGLLGCAVLLPKAPSSHRTSLLVLSLASVAGLTICTGLAEGRFAAMILLILLGLCRAAARVTDGPVAPLAIASLCGLPPFGTFPGLTLVVLTLSAHEPWLLLPLGAALVPIVLAGIPNCFPRTVVPGNIASIAWLPLLLAVIAGFFAPDGLVHWWRALTAGRV